MPTGVIDLTKQSSPRPPMRILRFHYDTLESTSDHALRLAASHRGEALLVIADCQSAGRGRHGRSWHSPRGGAWFTLAWPMTAPPDRYRLAPLLAAMAVVEAIERQCPAAANPPRIQIKWPNDLLLAGGKLAGILCQQDADAHTASALLRIGVGVNLNIDAEALTCPCHEPEALMPVSLWQVHRVRVDIAAVIDTAARRLTAALTALEGVDRSTITLALERLNARLAWQGQPVRLRLGEGCRCGSIAGIDAEGRLLLQSEAGIEVFDAGGIQQLRRDGAARRAAATDGTPSAPDVAPWTVHSPHHATGVSYVK